MGKDQAGLKVLGEHVKNAFADIPESGCMDLRMILVD